MAVDRHENRPLTDLVIVHEPHEYRIIVIGEAFEVQSTPHIVQFGNWHLRPERIPI